MQKLKFIENECFLQYLQKETDNFEFKYFLFFYFKHIFIV